MPGGPKYVHHVVAHEVMIVTRISDILKESWIDFVDEIGKRRFGSCVRPTALIVARLVRIEVGLAQKGDQPFEGKLQTQRCHLVSELEVLLLQLWPKPPQIEIRHERHLSSNSQVSSCPGNRWRG